MRPTLYMELHPLFFLPVYKYRLWGGEKLRTELHKTYDGEQIGESWEISSIEDSETVVANGEQRGKTIDDLIEKFGESLLGTSVYERFGPHFPLLIKFIDAKIPLSVQVHPNDEMAQIRHNSSGKNEMWYIMQADDNAEIIMGFKGDIDSDTYTHAVNNGTILDLLNTEKVTSGDVFHIPTGRIHAIGAGILLAEIQQTSDITYRVFDYDRIDKRTGKKRALHTELATEALDFKGYDSYRIPYSLTKRAEVPLLNTHFFKTRIIELKGRLFKDYNNNDSFVVLICVAQKAKLIYDKEVYTLEVGQTVLLPACINTITLEGQSARILEVSL